MSKLTRRGARATFLTPFGIYTRVMFVSYLSHTLMVCAALMTIALTIDLWPQVALLQERGGFLPWEIVRLTVLRLPDLLPPFIPFATFLGVVWSESAFTESRERMLVWNAGRSPLMCMVPALLAGLLMGAALFVIDALARPAAIHVQMEEVLGREGIRLDRSQSGGHHWIALPDGLLRAEIGYGPPVTLHTVTVYKLDSEGHLFEVDTADSATPGPNNLWHLRDGHYWRADFADKGDVLSNSKPSEEAEVPFQTRTVTLALEPLWLTNLGLSPQYIWMSDLKKLSRADIMARDVFGYRTRLQVIFGEPLLAAAMSLLGAGLSMLYFAYQTRWQQLIGVLLAGYLAHFASRALLLMGEFGYIPSVLAGWLAPVALLIASGGVLLVIQKRRGLGMKLQDLPQFSDTASSAE